MFAIRRFVRVVSAIIDTVAKLGAVQAHEVVAHHVVQKTLAMSGIDLFAHANLLFA